MDKSKFIELAPMYYAVAIRAYYETERSHGGVLSRISLQRAYSYDDESGSPDLNTFLDNDVLLDRAIQWLVNENLLSVMDDGLSPALYLQTERANDAWEAQEKISNSPYHRYKLTLQKERYDWLTSSLSKVNSEYRRLEIEADDFEKRDAEWEPLPLDRSDEKVAKTIEAVDATIEAVRADNGYSSVQPEEKAHVLDGLSAFSRALKTAESISIPYIKTYALEPLARVIKRFGPAAVGATAILARDTIFGWLKASGTKGLDALWRIIFGG